ncbi:MAG: hypothetical protein WB774_11250, partial [Xanthobacteraceae bacterium]
MRSGFKLHRLATVHLQQRRLWRQWISLRIHSVLAVRLWFDMPAVMEWWFWGLSYQQRKCGYIRPDRDQSIGHRQAHRPGAGDMVTLTVGDTVYSAPGDSNIPDLGQHWQIAEFNIFGNGDGSEAVFNPDQRWWCALSWTAEQQALP